MLRSFLKRSLLLILVLGFVFGSGESVLALSPGTLNAINGGPTSWANTEGGGGCGVASLGVFVGNSNHETAYNFLINAPANLEPWQAAGMVGNLHHESNGVNPRSKQGGNGTLTFSDPSEIRPGLGFGIAQWTTEGRQQNWINFANTEGLDPLSLDTQLLFLWQELTTNGSLGLEELRRAGDARQAAWIGLSYFERPRPIVDEMTFAQEQQPPEGSGSWEELNKRAGTAESVFSEYGDGQFAFAAGCDAGTGTPDFAANPNVQVDGSPSGAHNPANCTPGQLPGTTAMIEFIRSRWSPPVDGLGGHTCRAVINPTCAPNCPTSIHGLGRAIDIMIDAEGSELQTGDEIRNWLINNSTQYGVQRVIWNRHIWSANEPGWREFKGTAHTDHIHMELNIEAANNPDLI